jgi:transposase
VGFVGGEVQQRFVERVRDIDRDRLLAVPVDVGKRSAAALVCDFWGELVADPMEFELNESGFQTLCATIARAEAQKDAAFVRVGVEQAGHYHRTLVARLAAEGMDVVMFNPAQVKENRAQDLLRSVKSDHRDLCAMAELLVRGKGRPAEHVDQALQQQAALAAHRRRKVKARSALKNQIVGTLDLVFPGLDGCFTDLLGSKAGRVIVEEGLDPRRVRRLGPERLRRMCFTRGVILKRAKAEQIVLAARGALVLPSSQAAVSGRILAADVELLRRLDGAIRDAEGEMAAVLPRTPAAILTTMPLVSVVRATNYGAGVGDPSRFRSASQVYRMSGLAPRLSTLAGKKRAFTRISREGKVELREAIIDLGKALRLGHPDFGRYAQQMIDRGKRRSVVACALGHRANRVAFAMLRDQRPFDPERW